MMTATHTLLHSLNHKAQIQHCEFQSPENLDSWEKTPQWLCLILIKPVQTKIVLDVKPYSLKSKYWLVMTLYSPIVFLWTDPTDSELQTLKIEIQWEHELCRIELFCTMTMLILIKPVQA